MKRNPFVSSKARKVRKHDFNATQEQKHVALSAPLSKELRQTHGIRRLPVHREDEVQVVRGKYKQRSGKVSDVKLRSMRITVESVNVQKPNQEAGAVPLHLSNVVITKLKIDKDRKGSSTSPRQRAKRLSNDLATSKVPIVPSVFLNMMRNPWYIWAC
jgi:large subunit ribosomal protein L26e